VSPIQQSQQSFLKYWEFLNNDVKPTLVHKFLRMKVYVQYNGCPHSCIWKRNLNPSEKIYKKAIEINRDEIFQKTCRLQPFRPQKRNEEILEELKVEPVEEKLRRYKLNWL
jgi:organic radical activating enzyme